LWKLSAAAVGQLFGQGNEISRHPPARWLQVYQ
jgi:hypothetical protein